MAAQTTPVGERLLRAFKDRGISSKKQVAESLGFKSEAAIYKVINGERELGFEALRRFVQTTGRSIDWLLTGEESIIESVTDGVDSDLPDELHDPESLADFVAEDMVKMYERLAEGWRERASRLASRKDPHSIKKVS